ncbi:hypothetical protein NP493_5581g00000 [Ridgeia piscesae]|uniref:Uncharacterized protein n=1 Tax=Ridgeia piscesae TaxID=27915 RepID=A0AAD9ITU9_RIDPI|nr:hypothetical protein NP493_5581g00000 [Ridgeia piscesae]
MCEWKFPITKDEPEKCGSESSLLQNVLEPAILLDKFPKARMDVYVIVLQDDERNGKKHKDESDTSDGAITVGLMLSLKQISASCEEREDDTGQPTRQFRSAWLDVRMPEEICEDVATETG